LPLLSPKIISVVMLCKGFLATAGTKMPGQKSGFILFASLTNVHGMEIDTVQYPDALYVGLGIVRK
jgi:hypothetical protein